MARRVGSQKVDKRKQLTKRLRDIKASLDGAEVFIAHQRELIAALAKEIEGATMSTKEEEANI